MAISAPDPESLFRQASEAQLRGDSRRAELLCRQSIAVDPNHRTALALLGFIQLSAGRYSEALTVFDLLCRLEPAEQSHWINLGNSYRGTGDHEDALRAFARAAELGAGSADFLYNVALTHIGRGDFDAARAVLSDAMHLAPDDTEIRYRYVLCCYESLRYELALEALGDWQPPTDAPTEIVAGIAQMLLNMGEYSRAETIIQSAMARSEVAPGALLILVQVLERTNRLEEADAVLKRLRARPDSATLGAELQRVAAKMAQRQSRHELAVELYNQALVDYSKPHDRHFILFSLAESLHALGRPDEAIITLMEAHRSHVEFIERSRPLAAVRGTPRMQVTDFVCDPEDVVTWDHSRAPPASESPVFVVAFPRSGTTLLELTLDAHPGLVSMDEQPFVQNALEDIVGQGVLYPEQLGKLTDPQLDLVRARYWERAATKAQRGPGQRLVDKNPLNILRLPVIRRVFPNAAVLLAIRHPYDVLLSCYMQHFRAPDFALLCADMRALAIGYRRTFDFWYQHVELLTPRVREVRYESFVADIGSETRALAEFLQLDWNPAMLAPAERAHAKGYISTPSYSSVVQPVHARAVGRWQTYRKYLQPAYPIVEPYLKRWNYEV